MPRLGRLSSVARSALWLIRGSGLRGQMQGLEQEVSTIKQGVFSAVAQLPEQLEAVRQEIRKQLVQQQMRRWLEAGDLRAYEKRYYSQNGEDGILEEILNRIGTVGARFVEFGAQTGMECNCARLARDKGWHGLFLEADPAQFTQLQRNYQAYPGIQTARAVVSSANIEELLKSHAVPHEFDVLSIDIDGNDYWVWSAIKGWRPRVVVVEYNASYPPQRKWVMAENPEHRWDGTNYFGASLASLTALGKKKGYVLVGTNTSGVNAFFVREDLVTPDRFLDPMVHYHFSQPTFGPCMGSHPPKNGPHVEI